MIYKRAIIEHVNHFTYSNHFTLFTEECIFERYCIKCEAYYGHSLTKWNENVHHSETHMVAKGNGFKKGLENNFII